MAILNPDHLLAQADTLAATPSQGWPRQVDLRRAVSAAYYAVFHLVITAAADEFVGAALRKTKEYGLVQRTIDHAAIKIVCTDLSKPTPPQKYVAYLPGSGFGQNAIGFLAFFPDLQEARHAADYDASQFYSASRARSLIATARQAVLEWRSIPDAERKTLLYLILFPPKR